MKKTVIGALVSSVLVAAAMNGAYASTSTTVNIVGTVNTTTCDVVANTQNVNLGNATPADFTAINTPVAKTKQTFAISLQNCNGASAGQAQLKVTGPVSNAGSSYFSKDAAGAVAIGLTQNGTEISNGMLVDMGTKGADDAALNAIQLPFEAALKSSATNPAGGVAVEAPITFSFVYN